MLTDIEINKQIAEINGDIVHKHKGYLILSDDFNEVINTTCSGRYHPDQVARIIERASYSPLTDDALCFQLMVKYKINLTWEYDDTWICFVDSCLISKDTNPRKAICLAIIEANKA